MKWWKLALKLFLSLKTPLILILDMRYFIADSITLSKHIRETSKFNYLVDRFDCDDFAWVFKAFFNKQQINSVGFVIGLYSWGLHCWNCAVCVEGVFQIEPQTGELFKHKKGYIPLLVII